MKKVKINDRINLFYLPNPQLKVAIVSIYFRRPLSRSEVTLNSLIPDVLKCGTMRLQSESMIDKELQGLYGAKLAFSTLKAGERQILAFKMLMCADKYLPEPIMNNCFALLKEIIFEPYVVEGGFLKSFVDVEKDVLKEDILGKINNKGSYAVDQCVQVMCKDEVFAIAEDGYISDLEQIDEKKLYEHYLKLIATSAIDIVVAGDVEFDNLEEIVRLNFAPKGSELAVIPKDNIVKDVDTVKYVNESMEVSQGKLVMGFRTGVTTMDANYYDLYLYSAILGMGVSSKLFRNIREKNSLCYSIGASLEKFKGLMFITAGIEIENYDLAIKLINKELSDMSEANITKEELVATKLYLINALRSVKDSPIAISDFYFSQAIQGSDDTLDSVIAKIDKVTIEDIVAVAKGIKLDTVYFLTNKEVK